jgi:hypothetical protein
MTTASTTTNTTSSFRSTNSKVNPKLAFSDQVYHVKKYTDSNTTARWRWREGAQVRSKQGQGFKSTQDKGVVCFSLDAGAGGAEYCPRL